MEKPNTSKNINSSSSDDGNNRTLWQQPKPKKTTRRVDQTNDTVTIPTATRFKNSSEREWIREDVYENSDVSSGSNKVSPRNTTQVRKTTPCKDVKVEKNPEQNSHSPCRRNGLSCDSGERRSLRRQSGQGQHNETIKQNSDT